MKKLAGILFYFCICYSSCYSQPLDFTALNEDDFITCYAQQPDTSSATNNSSLYSPFAAGALAIIPGMGHFYLNEPLKGLAFLGGTGLALGFTYYSANYIDFDVATIGLLATTGIYIANIISAVNTAKAKNRIIQNKQISIQVIPSFETNNRSSCSNNFGCTLIFTL